MLAIKLTAEGLGLGFLLYLVCAFWMALIAAVLSGIMALIRCIA